MKKKRQWKRLCAGLLTMAMLVPGGTAIAQAESAVHNSTNEVISTEANYMSDEDYAAFGFSNLKDVESYVEEDYHPLDGYQPMILNELYIGHLNHPDDYQGYFAAAENVTTISSENLNLNTMQKNTPTVLKMK